MPGGGGHGGSFGGGGHSGGFGGGHGGSFGGGRGGGFHRGGMGFGFFPMYGFGMGRRGGCGCFGCGLVPGIIALVIAGALICSVFFGRLSGGHDTEITDSTRDRTPLDPSCVTETADYWESDTETVQIVSATLREGMQSFYTATGVQPFLYVTDSINGTINPSDSAANAYTEALYNRLFEDQGHLLVVLTVYRSNGYLNYGTWYWCGDDAWTVTDAEACEILLDYIDYYAEDDISVSEALSNAFRAAGERIMGGVTDDSGADLTLTFILGGVLAVVIVVLVVVYLRKKKNDKGQNGQNGGTGYNDGTGFSDGSGYSS